MSDQKKIFRENTTEFDWIIDANDKNRIEDLKELKRSRLKALSGNKNYHGYKFEFDIWNFFLSLNPNYISDITRVCKFEFDELDNKGSETLSEKSEKAYQDKKQTDIVAIFDHHAFIIECKSTEKTANGYSEIKKEIALANSLRSYKNERLDYLVEGKKIVPVHMFCTQGFNISSKEHKACLEKQKIILLSEKYKEYIETVRDESESGEFAFLQLLGFFRAGKSDYGDVEFDAFHSHSGKNKQHKVYTFSISPEQMLKISTVSHQRARLIFDSHDVKKSYYQRLLKKGRIREISKWLIENETPFPNNIIVSYRGKSNLVWEAKGETKKDSDQSLLEANKPGTLEFSGCPGTFHVIDGQHRLFSYTGVPKKDIGGLRRNHRVLVTAFEGLTSEEEANLFLEVNQKAKPVNPGLIMEIEYSSEEVFSKNLATAIVFSLRDTKGSVLYKLINEAEGTIKPLQPKAMQTAIHSLNFLNMKNFTQSNWWSGDKSWKNLLSCSENTFDHINMMLSVIKKHNEDIWHKKNKDNPANMGILQNEIMSGVLFVIDRITNEVTKNGPKNDEEQKEQYVEYITMFSKNLKKYDREELYKRVFNLDYYTAGTAAMNQIGIYFIHLFYTQKEKDKTNLQFKSDEEILRLVADPENRSPQVMQSLLRIQSQDVKKTLKSMEGIPIRRGSRNQRGTRYHNLIKLVLKTLFSASETYNGDPWHTLVVPAKLDNEDKFKIYEKLHKDDVKKGGAKVDSTPYMKIEGESLKKLLLPHKHLSARPAVELDEQKERIEKVLDYIWEKLLIFKTDDRNDVPKERPPHNSKFWELGTQYIDTFYTFRNVSDGKSLDDPHYGDNYAAVEYLEPLFDDYEKEFEKKVALWRKDYKEIDDKLKKQ